MKLNYFKTSTRQRATAKPSAVYATAVPLTGIALLLALSLPAVALAQSATGPELRLFSSTIVEDIRRTGEAAENMESGVLESIEYMDQQLELYKASNCESAGNDTGCGEMRRQLNESYDTMLGAMKEALPEMQQAIERSRDGLQSSLVQQIGRGLSPSGLMELMLDEGGPSQAARTARPSSSSGTRLSQRFRQYYSLVAGSAGSKNSGRGALVVTAADIYLDMGEAAELIQLTSDEIDRSLIGTSINRSLPEMTEQMELTVTGVKRVLFGEEDVGVAAGIQPPPSGVSAEVATGVDYASPLEY